MPPRRNSAKSTYRTTASRDGICLTNIPVLKGRPRYHATPQTAPPHTTARIAISSHARYRGLTRRVSHSYGFAYDLAGRRLARFLPQLDVGLEVGHQLLEAGDCQGLGAVADRLFGAGMDFEDEAVRADSHSRARNRRHQAALSSGVAGIEQDRQMCEFVQNGDRSDVAGVAGGGLKGADAALAEDHVRVAMRHDILRGHEQFLDGGTHAAFEQHRPAAASQRLQ